MTTHTPRTALAPTPLHLLSNIALAGVLCLSLAAPLANAADAAAQSKLTPSASSSLPPGMSAAETEAFAQFNRASAGQDTAIEPALAAWRGADDAEGGTLAEISLPWPASNNLTDARPAAQPVQKNTAK
jgi:hypothetical protein